MFRRYACATMAPPCFFPITHLPGYSITRAIHLCFSLRKDRGRLRLSEVIELLGNN